MRGLVASLLIGGCLGIVVAPRDAPAATLATHDRPGAAVSSASSSAPPNRASNPPNNGQPRLGGAPSSAGEAGGNAEAAGQAETEADSTGPPASEGDFLAENGLSSPMCREPGAIGAGARANCVSAGFAAAPAPTGDYAFDVHIDTGLGHLNNDVEAAVQDAAQWMWMALVALVRGLIVMLEWCYSLNLLSGVVMRQVASGLRAAASTFTTPLLAVVLAAASILAVYHGLIRRRVAQALVDVLVMLAMMVGGMWTVLDPADSVSVPAGWVNQASVGALGAVAGGTPDHPEFTLARAMQGLFSDVIAGPWCFLEVGNVRWCRDPVALDDRLRKTALRIAAADRALASAGSTSSSQRRSLLSAVALLESARSNGEIFLALPANAAARNSINESGSLLSVLCGGSKEATHCVGPTAPEAQFRTEHGTGPRLVGLLLIWAGALGMLALFGWIALRLLGAAILSLFFLLVAPAAVLAPAVGEGGRGLFRAWATRLMGALTAKLVYSLLLGVVLMMQNLLSALSVLGWWVQWLLISALWWIVFTQRHELLSLARVGDTAPWARQAEGRGGAPARSLGLLRRVKERTVHRSTDAALIGIAQRAKNKISPSPLSPARRAQLEPHVRRRARKLADDQVADALERDHRDAGERVGQAAVIQEGISAKRTRLKRLRANEEAAEARRVAEEDPASAAAGSEARAAAKLGARAERMEARIADEQSALAAARQTLAEGERAQQREGRPFSDAQLRGRSRFYDAQAALPDKHRRGAGGARRDYRRLAGLAGYGERDWDGLDAEKRHRAMLKIDDQLAARAGLERAGQRAMEAGEGSPSPRERRRVEREFQRAHEHEVRRRGHRMPASRESQSKLMAWLEHEREQAAKGSPTVPLAQRAREASPEWAAGDQPPAPARPEAREQLQRRRRQFGRPGRDIGDE